MARTITIDNVLVTQIHLSKDPTGVMHVTCEYLLRSGETVVQGYHKDLGQVISAASVTAVTSAYNAITQELSASELS